MKDVQWFNDQAAKAAHATLKEALRDVFPDHELEVVGFNRDFATEKIQVNLHLKPIARPMGRTRLPY